MLITAAPRAAHSTAYSRAPPTISFASCILCAWKSLCPRRIRHCKSRKRAITRRPRKWTTRSASLCVYLMQPALRARACVNGVRFVRQNRELSASRVKGVWRLGDATSHRIPHRTTAEINSSRDRTTLSDSPLDLLRYGTRVGVLLFPSVTGNFGISTRDISDRDRGNRGRIEWESRGN